MDMLIELKGYPVNIALHILLQDKTNKKNIVFATNAYADKNGNYSEKDEITLGWIRNFGYSKIFPRVSKSSEIQEKRKKQKAEVFTPSWICNKMNNYCDEEWFGRKNIFNIERSDRTWRETKKEISFPKGKTWQQYIDSRWLEITCGEAPFIVSRYDASSGRTIPISHRIGIIDRKLRVVNENAQDEKEWLKWAFRAFQSVYGYEYQGDNLLIARLNCLNTFCDYIESQWDREATKSEIKKIANIISWNLWQMDGLTGMPPFVEIENEYEQLSFFDSFDSSISNLTKEQLSPCRIYDWREKKTIEFNKLRG